MANDRLYIGNKETKEFVFVEKGWGTGWTGGHFDPELIQFFLENTFEDGNGQPTVLCFFSEGDDECYKDFFENGELMRRDKDGMIKTKPVSEWR